MENLKEIYKTGKFYRFNADKLSKLTFHPCNRPIGEAHVKRLMKSMEDNFRLFNAGSVLRVGINTGHLIDGQHRREAFFRLLDEGKIPKDSTMGVIFIDIAPEDELDFIRDIHTDVLPSVKAVDAVERIVEGTEMTIDVNIQFPEIEDEEELREAFCGVYDSFEELLLEYLKERANKEIERIFDEREADNLSEFLNYAEDFIDEE